MVDIMQTILPNQFLEWEVFVVIHILLIYLTNCWIGNKANIGSHNGRTGAKTLSAPQMAYLSDAYDVLLLLYRKIYNANKLAQCID